MKVLCMSCSLEFPTNTLYQQHKVEVHANHVPAIQKLPDGIKPEMLPDEEFIKTVQRIENPVVTQPEISTPTKVVPKAEPTPITLVYSYKGDCPTHNIPVDTIMLKSANRVVAVAYCSAFKHDISQRWVKPLSPTEDVSSVAKNASKGGKK